MPRTARSLVAGGHYHVINRGNNRATVFGTPDDFDVLVRLLALSLERASVSLLAACVMPNHFHLVVAQRAAGDISRLMHRLLTTHSRRHHVKHDTSGRVWQGRCKAFAVRCDAHLLTVMRYVERNPLRSGLVGRAEQWPWGSLAWRSGAGAATRLEPPPVALPQDWCAWVNAPQRSDELQDLRRCVNRQMPFGSADWLDTQTRGANHRTPPRPRGRPRKAGTVAPCPPVAEPEIP